MTAGDPTAGGAARVRRSVGEHLTGALRDLARAATAVHDCQLQALRLELPDLGAELGQAGRQLAAAELRLFKATRQLAALPTPTAGSARHAPTEAP